jgi:hypothetical protein
MEATDPLLEKHGAIVGFGKYRDKKTFAELVTTDPRYCVWLRNSADGNRDVLWECSFLIVTNAFAMPL